MRPAKTTYSSSTPSRRPLLYAGLFSLLFFVQSPVEAATALSLPSWERTACRAALGTGTGLDAIGANPASILVDHWEALTQFQPALGDSKVVLAGGAFPLFQGRLSLAADYLQMTSGSFERRDAQGRLSGSYDNKDALAGAHLGAKVPLPASWNMGSLRLGVAAKWMTFQIADRSAGTMAYDAGFTYLFAGAPLSLEVSAMNMGKGVAFLREESRLPSSRRVALSYSLHKDLVTTGNLEVFPVEKARLFSLSGQWTVGRRFMARGRYMLRRSEDAREKSTSSFSAGFGLRLVRHHTIDYAFLPFDATSRLGEGGGSHQISITYRFRPKPSQFYTIGFDGRRRVKTSEEQ